MGDFGGQDLQQIEIAALVDLGLVLADAGLAQQVDAEGQALVSTGCGARAGRTWRRRRR